MLPDHVLSSQIVSAPFSFPRNIPKAALIDYEYGGVDIQDPSKGLRVKVWKCEYLEGDFVVSAEGVEPVTVLTVANVAEIGFSFDSNMNPFVCYQLENGTAKYYWFDSTVPGFVTSTLPSGSTSPRCCYDDNRASQVARNITDVILAYTRAGSLYFRAQRDRYLTEYLLSAETGDSTILQMGINEKLRLQFRMTATVGGSGSDTGT